MSNYYTVSAEPDYIREAMQLMPEDPQVLSIGSAEYNELVEFIDDMDVDAWTLKAGEKSLTFAPEWIAYYVRRLRKLLNLCPPSKPLIALCGKSKTGKTTIAKLLSECLGIPIASFAAPLKAGVEVMGLPADRRLYQEIGTEVVRKYYPEHWIEQLFLRHSDCTQTGLVVDDVRFDDEARELRSRGFMLAHLYCESSVRRNRGAGINSTHASEAGVGLLNSEVLYNTTQVGVAEVSDQIYHDWLVRNQ